MTVRSACLLILLTGAIAADDDARAEGIDSTNSFPTCRAYRSPDDYRPGPPPAGINPVGRMEELRRMSRRAGLPDSVVYAIAFDLWRIGTIESRDQALQTLDEIRPAYEHDPEYYWRRGMIYEDRQEQSLALDALEEAVSLDPHDMEAYVEITRLRLKSLLFQFDLSLTPGILEAVHSALALCPDHHAALLLNALACEMAGGLTPLADPVQLGEGLRAVDRLLAANEGDREARLLRGVLLDDLGRIEDGEREFTRALADAPEEQKAAFASLEWTALPAAVDEAKAMDASTRGRFEDAYWQFFDPTPLSLTNENQLINWKRLVLADLLFGNRRKSIRGWNTDPGKIFVRYGSPVSNDFDPGEVLVDVGVDGAMGPFHMGASYASHRPHIKAQPPAWAWDYQFRGIRFGIRFEDRGFNGTFYMDEASVSVAQVLRGSVPVVFQEAPPGKIGAITLVGAGVAAPGHLVRETVELGVPIWRPDATSKWIDRVRLEIVVKDSTRAPVARAIRRATVADLAGYFGNSLNLLVAREEFDLKPGRYTAIAYVDDDDRKIHGNSSIPIQVGTFAESNTLAISDIHLALADDPEQPGPRLRRFEQDYRPDPLGFAEDDRKLEVYYELYGLAANAGVSRHKVRYTVLPRAYVLEYERLARDNKVRPNDIVTFASEELAAGGSDLTPDNYLDVFFPTASLSITGGHTPKGARVPIPDLLPDDYGLIVTVTDEISNQTTTNRAFFRILTPEQRHGLAALTKGN